jgi:hypothetical protein
MEIIGSVVWVVVAFDEQAVVIMVHAANNPITMQ